MPHSYYLGLDLGQSKDFSALAVAEVGLWVPPHEAEYPGWGWHLNIGEPGWVSPASMNPRQAEEILAHNFHEGRPPDPPLSVRHLERFPLGTRYPVVVERVGALLSSAPLRGKRVALLVDATGVGGAVVDHFERAGLSPIAVSIHGGDSVGRDPLKPGYRVPKRDLVGAVQVLLQTGRLKVAEGMPESEILKKELSNFRVKIDPRTAHDSYSHWREADHDDLVLATAMACWFREWYSAHVELANAGLHAARRSPGAAM